MSASIDLLVQRIALAAIPVTFAITLHEAAHGYAARHFGDYTADRAGRISLNPLRHIDPVGTIVIPLVALLTSNGAMLFGWAKPVPVDFGQLHNPKRDMLWVAAAGPGANLFMALCWAIVLKFVQIFPANYFSEPLRGMADFGIRINTVLMILNLFPLPPLDGGRIAMSLLPGKWTGRFAMLERYGIYVLLALLVTGVLGMILSPFIGAVLFLLSVLFNLR